jgi:OmpA-OmpF porin, OOP family
MNRILVFGLLSVGMAGCVGCATKQYVRNQVAPLRDKTTDLDQRAVDNAKGIKEVDAHAQQSIAAANTNVQNADQNATTAGSLTMQAKDTANTCQAKASALANIVANVDNYQVVAQTLLKFGFDRTRLTREAQQQLDQLGAQLTGSKSYIVVVQGGSDSQGNKEYNYELSQRRAEEVVRYLSNKYKLPPYKVYAIGVGDDKPVAPNDTQNGREKNRRAEVQLLNRGGNPSSFQSDPPDSDEEQVGQLAPTRH